MKEAVCRYCGRDIQQRANRWYYRRGKHEPNGFLCLARETNEDLAYRLDCGHEPLTKEDKVLEILRTYENTTRLTNKH